MTDFAAFLEACAAECGARDHGGDLDGLRRILLEFADVARAVLAREAVEQKAGEA